MTRLGIGASEFRDSSYSLLYVAYAWMRSYGHLLSLSQLCLADRFWIAVIQHLLITWFGMCYWCHVGAQH